MIGKSAWARWPILRRFGGSVLFVIPDLCIVIPDLCTDGYIVPTSVDSLGEKARVFRRI